MMNKPAIELSGLSYRYPEESKNALEKISLEIFDGEAIFLCGNSGSGKTTLGKTITGAIPHFYGGTIQGKISFRGKNLLELSHLERGKAVTMVFQDPEVQLLMNKVHHEIAFGLENLGVEPEGIKRRVWESMEFCNILSLWDREISTLSGGEKQKVAIASALAFMPKCILFDEPTSQLDPLAGEEIISLIAKVNRELTITVIVIEQRIDKCFELMDRILFLDQGRLLFNGSKKEFYENKTIEVDSFLPIHLRLAKHAGMIEMPTSIKETREGLPKKSLREKGITQPKIEKKSRPFIHYRNFSTGYEARPVLHKMDFKVMEGDFIGILGPNGAGKTTLLKATAGLLPYRGSLEVAGTEIASLSSLDIGALLGLVSQNPRDYLSKDSVFEELKFTLDNFGCKDYSVIDEVLHQLDLEALRHKNPRDLSGGERQRVAIASVLVHRQKLLLLDEPTRGLDVHLKNELRKLLQRLNQEGITIVLVTHDLEFAAECCSRFALLFDGNIIAQGDHEAVFNQGIFYTTAANKIFRDRAEGIYTLAQGKEWLTNHG